ncbi:MAG: oxidoreductase [Thermoplasmata archaeon]
MTDLKKPKVGIWKFTSCSGCQQVLLNCEDELLELAEVIEIANFREASSIQLNDKYNISLVEGSITTLEDARKIQEIRTKSKILITIGACATAGGIQALRNFANVDEFRNIVYAKPEYISTLSTSTPIQEHVPVDFELRGCPINKYQFLDVIISFLSGRNPNIQRESLCSECKRNGNICVMVTRGIPCLGPITQAGCGAICPSYNRGCYGCFGPHDTPNSISLVTKLNDLGMDYKARMRIFRTFNTGNPVFRAASELEVKREGKK